MASTVDSKRVREYNEELVDRRAFERKLDKLADMVRESRYTVFYTGAGVSTSAGVGDYRGPSGAWTKRKIKQLEAIPASRMTPEDREELSKLKEEAAREERKAARKVDMLDAQPTPTHMAQATLIRRGLAHYVVTTNLDGIYRKAGLQGHTQLCCLHGDVYVERCTACGYDFERNYHVRQDHTHVHDHKIGTCKRCGSAPPKHYTGRETPGLKMKKSQWGGQLIGTRDTNCGTKDTHINFGEHLDHMDWDEAEKHCGQADLCIIAGTSMSLRHITHFPFMAKKVALINLQPTPDDDQADLRIWAKCDPVFEGVMQRLGIEIDPVPVWRPRDAVPLNKIPRWVHPYYAEKAKGLELMAQVREMEAEERRMGSLQLNEETETTATVERTSDKSSKKRQRKDKEKEKKSEREKESSKKAATLALPSQLLVGNKHELVRSSSGEDNRHKWTMFVGLPDELVQKGLKAEDMIERVEYDLHPTFSPSKISVPKAPYELKRLGWGYFDVGVTVYWRSELNQQPARQQHPERKAQERGKVP
ncbi:Transcriptional regulator, Sir2 family protein [Balamuthia mandrillaris]